MASIYDDPRLAAAQGQAQQAQAALGTAEQSDTTLPDMLRDALTKKFSSDNPLYKERESALSRYMTETTQAPLDYTHTSAGGKSDVVYSPLEQANLIQQRKAGAVAPLTTANDLLALITGGIDTTIDAASRASQAKVQGLRSTAELKRQNYTDILGELSARADEAYKNQSLALQASKANAKKDLSASERTKANMFKAALKLVDDNLSKENTFAGSGPIPGWMTTLFADHAPFLSNSKLATTQSNIGPVREQVVNAISGANVSAQEAERVMSWLPDIRKSPETNQRNLTALKSWLNANYETITGEPYESESSVESGDADPLGIL